MKPLDPRLMRYAKAARNYIIFIVITGFFSAALVIAQSVYIAWTISPVISQKSNWTQVAPYVGILLAIFVARVMLILIRESRAHRAATRAIAQIRSQVLSHAKQLGPRWLARRGADTVTLATRGLDDLGPYFTQYLPQLILSVTVTPLALAVMLYLDPWSALVAVVTIPLIPIFMILIGKLTQEFSDKRLATMQQLGRQLLDLVSGLATLKALGRDKGPATHIRRIGKTYTKTTMSTLSLAFLSGAVLEFIAILSVALVAVEVGMRLVYGNIDLATGLIIIMLAPEVYNPLREVGKQFHASADGLTAAQAAFEIIEQPIEKDGTQDSPDLSQTTIVFDNVSVAARGSWAPSKLCAQIRPNTISALVGPSGTGKTTAVMTLLKQLHPQKGQILIRTDKTETNLQNINTTSWYSQVAWVPQQPVIVPGTLLDNLGLTRPTPALLAASTQTGFDSVVSTLPQGWDTRIGQGGQGLSVGQRQRLALIRALLNPEDQLVILDEPTAHLDAALEGQVIKAVTELKAQGKTVIIIAHRTALLRLADQIIEVSSEQFTAEESTEFSDHEITGSSAQLALEPALMGEWKAAQK